MKLLDGSILIFLVLISLSFIFTPEKREQNVSNSKELLTEGSTSDSNVSANNIKPDLIISDSLQASTENSSEPAMVDVNNISIFFKYLSVVLIIILIFILNKLRKQNKRVSKIQSELNSYKDQLSKFDKNTSGSNRVILQQVAFTLKRLNNSLNNENFKEGSKEKDLIYSFSKQLGGVLYNSGCKKITPKIGQSVRQDSILAQRVEVIESKKSSKPEEAIGIIYEVIHSGYETIDGDVLIKSQVAVFGK